MTVPFRELCVRCHQPLTEKERRAALTSGNKRCQVCIDHLLLKEKHPGSYAAIFEPRKK